MFRVQSFRFKGLSKEDSKADGCGWMQEEKKRQARKKRKSKAEDNKEREEEREEGVASVALASATTCFSSWHALASATPCFSRVGK